ncbi:hypothetical protein L211DRAFT_893443 [Terfezia boudieri ATCC MYA-4762]|uniref:Uncharacterized protein n=1 Tax=Terfezia boudieri ATCC MYA-4762 TaxID=1051890 RepID=A0A3N4LBX3_9PEZI|nr:hypothetical protein L211DRAFT_893443 [Terfezia boudieri ATCC MYA-4762]
MDRLIELRRRLEKYASKSKLTKEASNLQLEAEGLRAALASCITQQRQTVSDLVQTITRELSLLEQDTQTRNNTVTDMNMDLKRIQGKNAEQERQLETELQNTIKDFVEGKIVKKLPTLGKQVDEVLNLIEKVRIDLNDAELGFKWLEEVRTSVENIGRYIEGWGA